MHVSEKKRLNKDDFDLTKFIRSLQRLEGNPDCFGKAKGLCSRLDCAWRRYCLDPKNTRKKPLGQNIGDERDPIKVSNFVPTTRYPKQEK